MSALASTYRCHPCALTLVVTRNHNGMIFLYGNELCYWLVKDLAPRTTRECCVNWRSRNNDRNVCWTLQSGLLRHAWLGISLEIQRMVRRLISILELGLGSIDLRGMTSVFLQLERSEPTTWEVTSAQVQKHNLSTMLSKQANKDSFSNSKALALNSDHSIRSFNTTISAHCLLTCRKNLSCSLSAYASLAQLLSAMASAYALTLARSFFI